MPTNTHTSQTRNIWLRTADSMTMTTDSTMTMNRTVSSSRNRVHPGESPPRFAPHHPPHHLLAAPRCAMSLTSPSPLMHPCFSCHISTVPATVLHLHHISCHISITPASHISPATLTLPIGGDHHPKSPPTPFPNPTHVPLPTSAHSNPHHHPFDNPATFKPNGALSTTAGRSKTHWCLFGQPTLLESSCPHFDNTPI